MVNRLINRMLLMETVYLAEKYTHLVNVQTAMAPYIDVRGVAFAT